MEIADFRGGPWQDRGRAAGALGEGKEGREIARTLFALSPIPIIEPDKLPTDWTTNFNVTREIGDRWLVGDGSVLLSVPSAIVPRTFNSLFNPLHPQAREFEIKQSFVYPFDMRIRC